MACIDYTGGCKSLILATTKQGLCNGKAHRSVVYKEGQGKEEGKGDISMTCCINTGQ